MGVEPTRDRLAAPHGFEVRTPHRGRFSSVRIVTGFAANAKQVQAGRVDPAPIAPAQGHAAAIEELEDLDRDLAPVGQAIAELGGGKAACLGPAARSAAIATISRTVGRRKKWSCATSSAQPMRPASLRIRRMSASGRPVAAAMSRTRGGRNRSSPPSSGATISQAAMSSAVSLTSCEGA